MNSRRPSTTNPPNKLIPARELYDSYGAKLPGYISDFVNDENIAGQYPIEVIISLPG